MSISKSQLFVSGNTPPAVTRAIHHCLQIAPVESLGCYLGMPLLHQRITSRTYTFLYEKLKKKLAGWKSKILSQSGRALLIQSVLSAQPSYAMQTFKLPMETVDLLDKHIRRFFWNETDKDRNLHYLSWDKLCQPKWGGLGFKRLRALNIAYLAKIGWQVLIQKDALWVRTLKAKYCSPLDDQRSRNVSPLWRGYAPQPSS